MAHGIAAPALSPMCVDFAVRHIRRSGGKKSSLESVLVVNDGSSRLEAGTLLRSDDVSVKRAKS